MNSKQFTHRITLNDFIESFHGLIRKLIEMGKNYQINTLKLIGALTPIFLIILTGIIWVNTQIITLQEVQIKQGDKLDQYMELSTKVLDSRDAMTNYRMGKVENSVVKIENMVENLRFSNKQ